MHVEVIDRYSFSSENIIHETISVEVISSGHNNLIIFNMIKSHFNPIILELL